MFSHFVFILFDGVVWSCRASFSSLLVMPVTANPRNVGTSWPKYWPQVAKILAPGCQNVGPSCPIFWPHHFYGGSLTFRKWVTHDGIQRLCGAGISNESLFTSIGALHASTSQKWVKFDTQHKVFCIPWFQSVAVA